MRLIILIIFLFNSKLFCDYYNYIKNTSTDTFKYEKIQQKKEFGFTQQLWNEMRTILEEKKIPKEKIVVSTSQSEKELKLPPPQPGAVIELPYEARLSISGRKLIGFSFSHTEYLHEEKKKFSTTSFDMQQELQVTIKGQIGKKVSVNVDFDDTQPDKRDISVIYQGDPNEIIQEAEFGDIDASLPQTEFVGYRKQVFGAKLRAKYKNLSAIGIWSQSKGTPATKRFMGNTTLERKEILDINYIRRKYYDLVFDTNVITEGSIVPGTEKIFVDNKNPTDDVNGYSISVTTFSNSNTSVYTGYFNLLTPGKDYTIDYFNGIIYFRTQIQQNYIIAIDYQFKNKSGNNIFLRDFLKTTYYILIKDEYETDNITTELKNYYNIGRTKITRDDGKGNFTFYVMNPNRERDDNIAKYPENIIVDFETGIFYTKNKKPFANQVYNPTPVTTNYKFFIEYRYAKKIFDLQQAFIVPYSERILLDGTLLNRDVDYYMDYDAGIVTFLNEEKIKENTIIDISYEYGGFGLTVGETFLGTRVEFSPLRNFYIGSSILGNIPVQSQTIPDLKSVSQSLSVYEFDTRIQDIPLLFGIKTSIQAEVAQSYRNPNIKGKAIIDSMESISQEDTVSLYKDLWKYGRTPNGVLYPSNAIKWDFEEDIPMTDINPNAQTNEKQRVLRLDYNHNYNVYTTTLSETSVCQSLSNIGVDFSKKLYLELWIQGDAKNTEIQIDLGQFNEDVDGDGLLDTEDKNHDGTLNPDEDSGWLYDVDKTYVFANNAKIDSEDLDADGTLNTFDRIAGTYKIENISWNEWKYFRIPLNIENPSDWTYIKQIRITIRNPQNSGTIRFAKISIVGNKWENLTPQNISIYGINNQDYPNYESLLNNPDYKSLYGEQITEFTPKTTKKEQALALNYNLSKTSDAIIQTLTKSLDFSKHEKLKFFLYGDNSNIKFYFRAGSDDKNFFQYETIINWSGWKLISIDLKDINNDGVPDKLEPSFPGQFDICITSGKPSFTNILNIKIILSNDFNISGKSDISGEIWLNEIFLDGARTNIGNAFRINTDMNIPGLATLGYRFKTVDRKFETFTAAITNQDRTEESANLNFTKLNFMPLNISGSRTKTDTPAAIQTGENLVSVLHEGHVLTENLNVNTGLNINKFPQITGSYSISISSINNPSQNIFRNDISQSRDVRLNYTIPVNFFVIPKNLNLRFNRTDTIIEPWQIQKSTENPKKTETADTVEMNTSFAFWNFLSFNPAYSLKTAKEKRDLESLLQNEIEFYNFGKEYTKSKTQTFNTNLSLRLIKWFNPSFNYNITTNETYNFPISDKKLVDRSGSGNMSLSIALADILPLRPLKTLNVSGSYRLEGGDKYENIESSYPSIIYLTEDNRILGGDELWIFKPLEPKSPSARRTLLTNNKGINFSTRWNLFEWVPLPKRFSPVNSLAPTLNYSESTGFKDETGTKTEKYTKQWPDIVISISEIEKMFWLEKILQGSQINYNTSTKIEKNYSLGTPLSDSWNKNESVSANFRIFKEISIYGSYSQQQGYSRDLKTDPPKITGKTNTNDWSLSMSGEKTAVFNYKGLKLTPKIGFRTDQAWSGDPTDPTNRKLTRDTRILTVGLQAYMDKSFPGGILLPIVGKTLPLTNRLIFNTNIDWTKTDSPEINIERDNTDKYNLNTGVQYEISQNLRADLNLGFNWFTNRKNSKDDNYNISVGTHLNIIF